MTPLRARFDAPVGDDMRDFCTSLPDDLRLADEEIDASIAHVTMLGETGIVGKGEARSIAAALDVVREELRSGAFRPGPELEDIHLAVEQRVTERLGDLGKKLHTARSRNDQIATDVRLWLKRAIDALSTAVAELIGTLLERVERDGRTLIPGYTHLQRGQPILLGHHLLAHAWALSRDRERLAGARQRVDRSPLGACAMAGTPHPIDRRRTAELLGFAGVVENAMDAVAARDHVQEVAAACAIAMTHLSRMAEELVLWSSAEFALVRIDAAYATGSSIMPQKRNPDAAELVRGKTARVHGDLATLFSLVRALPLAYNRDLQEDRRALFDAVDQTLACTKIMSSMWRTLAVDSKRFERELAGDPSLATELADLLVQRGVPFREAHEAIGTIVRWCEERHVRLDALTPERAREFHPRLDGDLAAWLDPRAAAERRTSLGGTAWSEIERQVRILRETLSAPRPDHY